MELLQQLRDPTVAPLCRTKNHVTNPNGKHAWLRKPGYPSTSQNQHLCNTSNQLHDFSLGKLCKKYSSKYRNRRNQSKLHLEKIIDNAPDHDQTIITISSKHLKENNGKSQEFKARSYKSLTEITNKDNNTINTGTNTPMLKIITIKILQQPNNNYPAQNPCHTCACPDEPSIKINDILMVTISLPQLSMIPQTWKITQPRKMQMLDQHLTLITTQTPPSKKGMYSTTLISPTKVTHTPMFGSAINTNPGAEAETATLHIRNFGAGIPGETLSPLVVEPSPSQTDTLDILSRFPRIPLPPSTSSALPTSPTETEGQRTTPQCRPREDEDDNRPVFRNEYRFITAKSMEDNITARYNDMCTKHYFFDVTKERYKWHSEVSAAMHLAKGEIVGIKLGVDRRTCLTRMKESEAIHGCVGVIYDAALAQRSVLERPPIGRPITGAGARDAMRSLSGHMDTAQRLKDIATGYHDRQLTILRNLDRQIATTTMYTQAASNYLIRGRTPIGPLREFIPTQELPEVFTSVSFQMKDFDYLEYQHLEAIITKFVQYPSHQQPPSYNTPEHLLVGIHRKGPGGDPDHLYQTERDIRDHVTLLELQYELSLTTGAELKSSYELKETINRMLPLGGAIHGATTQYLKVSNDLQAVFLSINAVTPTPELNTTHIEGVPLITAVDRHPFHSGSLTLATENLLHPMPDTFQVTRHEHVLSGDLETRRARTTALQQSIRHQLCMIRDHQMQFLDYDPLERLPNAIDKEDDALDGLRRSFLSFLHYLE